MHCAAGHTWPSPVHSSSCRVPVLRSVSNCQQFDSVSRRCGNLLCTGLAVRTGSDACRYIPDQAHAGTNRIRCIPVHNGSDACRHIPDQILTGTYRIGCMPAHTGSDAYRYVPDRMHAGTYRIKCLSVRTGSASWLSSKVAISENPSSVRTPTGKDICPFSTTP